MQNPRGELKMERITREELLKKAEKPAEEAERLHGFYQGKIEVTLKAPIRNFDDFSIWYTPGVARPCQIIKENPEKVWEFTNRSNFVAVVSDGTRVLGLGDIGPEAGLPVMEGKALLFKYLGGIDAFPICIREKDPDKFCEIVKALEPSFGGINLEDIAQPKCFEILERLRAEMNIPVWHDDQQGTATITYAGLVNACKLVGKRLDEIKIAMVGAGAANVAILRVLVKGGVKPENVIVCDSRGILHPDRKDIKEKKEIFKEKWWICNSTNGENIRGDIEDAMNGADVLISAAKPGPGVIKKEWIKKMEKDAICFVMANPVPEIWPWDAKEAGAKIVATGRGDFPNQINNSLGFPGIFRGVLDVWAKSITDEMCIAAGNSLAESARKRGINEDYIVPRMDEWEVYIDEAVACGLEAIRQGVARRKLTGEELRRSAEEKIKRAREEVHLLMEKKIIPEV